MATDLTQDALLHFLQSRGGSVRNADLLLHFRGFIRDHEDRNHNRELFKKFVNSVATVRQIDGVSYVALRKKFRGHVPGGDEGSTPEPPRVTAGKSAEPSPENAKRSPAWSAEKPRQKPPQREVTTPAPAGVTANKTVLPAAGFMLINNNNNVETNLNLKQVISTPGPPGRPAAQLVIQTPSPSEPPAPDQSSRADLPPPVVPAVRHHGEVQVPETLRGREAWSQHGGGLHQDPPLRHTGVKLQDAPRRLRHRKSYKTAVSYDEDEEEDEEEVSMRRGSAGGARPLSAPLQVVGGTVAASSLSCITDPSAPASSPERKLPKIYVQDAEGETLPPGGPGLHSESGERGRWDGPGPEPRAESASTRRSLPVEAERRLPSPERPRDRRYSQPSGVQMDPNHGAIFPTSTSDRPPPGSKSRHEERQARAAQPGGGSKIQEVLQPSQEKNCEPATRRDDGKTTAPWHHSTGHLHDDREPVARLSPLHRSAERLHADQTSTARVSPWHLSTGDLYDDREGAESSEGSTSSPPPRLRPAVARRLSSQLRSRMCRSLGADLDQLLQEEDRTVGGSEAARLNRLHMISSSLSLRYNLSSSSLSSCSTPPRCHSFADLTEAVEEKGGRRRSSPVTAITSSPPSSHHVASSRQQSLFPLEPREHAWLVKAAAAAWPDIYTLFREDSSLLNRQDFISGFTVLHWIAKHGDHRVLNTLWYGVQKAGLTFDINAKSTCGHTPLHIAAIHGNRNMMRLLVNKFNADLTLRDTAGKKPWQYLSPSTATDVLQLLGAPLPAGSGEGGEQGSEQHQKRRRRRHHLSFASSANRPMSMTGTTRVKRSSSIAAFLKHKSMLRFHGHQSDASV